MPALTDLTPLQPHRRMSHSELAKLGEKLKVVYESNVSIRALADHIGRSYAFVHAALVAANTDMRTRGGRHPATGSRGMNGHGSSPGYALLTARNAVGGDYWFRRRGWKPDTMPGGNRRSISFSGSFGALNPVEKQLFSTRDVVGPLSAVLTASETEISVEITTCGVVNGCPAHRSRTQPLGPTSVQPGFDDALHRWESHAGTADGVRIVQCLIAGECGACNPACFPDGPLTKGVLRNAVRDCIAELKEQTGQPLTVLSGRIGISTHVARTLLREHRQLPSDAI